MTTAKATGPMSEQSSALSLTPTSTSAGATSLRLAGSSGLLSDPKALGVPALGGGVLLFALLLCLLRSPGCFLGLLKRHLENGVFCVERTDLSTQCVDDGLRIYVHAAHTNTYNGWYG